VIAGAQASVLGSIDEIAAVIETAAQPDRRIVVGIVGPPGAGKSTIADAVVEQLNLLAARQPHAVQPHASQTQKTQSSQLRWMPRSALLPMDGFHLPQQRLVELGRRDRMGAPDTFDVDGFIQTLTALKQPAAFDASGSSANPGNSGNAVFAPGFDRSIEEAVPNQIAILPEFPIVVVEGNYLLLGTDGWERAAPLLDLTFYVQLDQEERLRRLVDRHVRFGKTADAARAWALGPDEANAMLIAATSTYADHIITL
jgi:pantothenate kinase